MLKLNEYEQQIILASKGHSKMKDTFGNKLSSYEVIKNIIARMTKLKIEYINDHKIYYWLLQIIKKLDDEFNFDWRNQLLNSMFNTDWIFSRTNCKDNINVVQVNKKLISMLGWVSVKDDNKYIIELNEDEEILNKMYK